LLQIWYTADFCFYWLFSNPYYDWRTALKHIEEKGINPHWSTVLQHLHSSLDGLIPDAIYQRENG